jgi:hypothetical protein
MTRSPAPAGAPPTAQCGAPAADRNVPGGTTASIGGGQCRGATAKSFAGVTISRNSAKRPTGSVPASNASHARSGHVNRE